MRTYSKELRFPTRPSRRAPVIYRFELLVAYNGNKLYVGSSTEHSNLDVLVRHELTPTEKEEAEDF
jgi:hypothetical protein